MRTHFPVIVIGAGVIGQAIARTLLHAGRDVALVAPADPSGSASPAAGAMVDAFGECERHHSALEQGLLALRLESQRRYPAWLDALQAESERRVLQHPGIFLIGNAGGDHDLARLALIRRLMREHAEPFEEWAPSEVPGLSPNVGMAAHSALLMPRALSVDIAELQQSLETALSRQPRLVRVVAQASDLRPTARGWRLALRHAEPLHADQVVLAAGAHSSTLLSQELKQAAGLPEVHYGRGASLIVEGGPALPHTLRTTNRALACGIHLVPRAAGRLYLGASNLFGTDLDRPTGPSVGELHSMLGTVCDQLNTSLRNLSVSRVQWGLRPVTPTGEPLIGACGLQGLHLATGMHRCGITMAPLVAEMVADGLLERRPAFANPFPIGQARDTTARRDVRLGMRSLLATALYPDGRLPYNRSEELEVFLSELFTLALQPEADEELRRELRQLCERIPLPEQGMIRVFHEVLQRRIPDKGPYAL